jgi:predicted phage tail protein
MKTIYLHGSLKEKYGPSFKFDVPTPAMAISALCSQVKGFMDDLRGGSFILIRGDRERGMSIDETELRLKFGHTKEFHIIPTIHGGGGNRAATVKIVLGVALIGIGVGGGILAGGLGQTAISLGSLGGITYGAIAATGLALTVGGISMALTPRPTLGGYEDRGKGDRPSFLFNGPINVSQQGLAVPIVYGRMRVGSVVVSTGLRTEAI